MRIEILPKTDTSGIRSTVFDDHGMKVLPAEKWLQFDWNEVRTLMHETGTYVLPTAELISYLRLVIDGRKAIEIAAGNGWIGRALGIPMTDSYQQRDDPGTVLMYKLSGQPLIDYPDDVVKMEANEAVDKYSPDVVIGSYVTHKYMPGMRTGNAMGVDFGKLLPKVKMLVLVGNKVTHADNPIMTIPHLEVKLDGLITRSADAESNRIFIWRSGD